MFKSPSGLSAKNKFVTKIPDHVDEEYTSVDKNIRLLFICFFIVVFLYAFFLVCLIVFFFWFLVFLLICLFVVLCIC